MYRIHVLLMLGGPVLFCLQGCEAGAQGSRNVNCGQGQGLAQAVATAPPGKTILVQGVCNESITIETDGLTVDGGGTAVVDGGGITPADSEFNAVVTVDGARGVTLRGLSVRNGPAEGVLTKNAATVTFESMVVDRNGFAGIAVSEHSMATFDDVTSMENAIGADVYDQSTVVARGDIALNGNGGSGLEINAGSLFEIRGANVVANGNDGAGIVAGNSQIAILGFTDAQGSSITANDNAACGIFLPTGKLSVMGGRFFGSAANEVTTHNNGECGIRLPLAGYIESPFATASFSVQSNPIGLWFGEGSGAAIIGGLLVQNNDTGVLADGAGAMVLVSVPPSPHDVTGNGTDIDLRFGSRMTFGGPPFVGSVVCDGTALARGSADCP